MHNHIGSKLGVSLASSTSHWSPSVTAAPQSPVVAIHAMLFSCPASQQILCLHAAAVIVEVFVELGVLTAAEVEEVLVTEFNPVRIAIGDTEIITRDVLNCGVHPKPLLDIVKQRFLEAGG